MTKIEFNWEELHENSDPAYRLINNTTIAKVSGGWLVHYLAGDEEMQSESMGFFPDPKYEWKI